MDLAKLFNKEEIMNYDNDPDFNKARTPKEATKEFATARAVTFDAANKDFGVGVKYGLLWAVVVGLLFIGLAPDILGI